MAGEERNNLGGRVRRYARVTSAVGGVAARMAGQRYLGLKNDPTKMAEDLRAALGGLKGPLMKVAQILSTIPDALPEDFSRELSQLQANAPTMGWPFVKRRMSGELGSGWQRRYADFDRNAAAAASLGQVHKAHLLDGTPVACKLQYPDMDSVVEADLKQLRLIISLYRQYDSAIDPSDVLKEISDRLREELDYEREAANMRLYAYMLRDEPNVHVPEAFADLSSKRLLTMSWQEGGRLMDFTTKSDADREALSLNMFRAWYVPFYFYGVIHGDPHLGNYTVRPDLSVNLLDFGAIRVFRPAFVQGVIDLYFALREGDQDRAVHAYETWGFDNLSKEVIDTLNLWAAFVYAPLMEDRSRLIQEKTSPGAYGREVAEKVHKELKAIGGVRPPREFVLMDRAAIGLGSVFLHLKAEINWYRLFHDLIDDFDPAILATRQAEALTLAGLEHLIEPEADSAAA